MKQVRDVLTSCELGLFSPSKSRTWLRQLACDCTQSSLWLSNQFTLRAFCSFAYTGILACHSHASNAFTSFIVCNIASTETCPHFHFHVLSSVHVSATRELPSRVMVNELQSFPCLVVLAIHDDGDMYQALTYLVEKIRPNSESCGSS